MKPDLQEAHRHFLTLLPRTYWLLRSVVDARLQPMGLSSAQWRPLILLDGAGGPMTQVQIARALGLESPTVVRLLDRLADKGWITRSVCPGDRRAYHVELTAEARALCADIDRVLAEVRATVLADVSATELAQATAVLERVQARLTSLDEAAPLPAPHASRPGRLAASLKMRAARRTRRPGTIKK